MKQTLLTKFRNDSVRRLIAHTVTKGNFPGGQKTIARPMETIVEARNELCFYEGCFWGTRTGHTSIIIISFSNSSDLLIGP